MFAWCLTLDGVILRLLTVGETVLFVGMSSNNFTNVTSKDGFVVSDKDSKLELDV